MKNKNLKKLMAAFMIGAMVLPVSACGRFVNIGKQYEEAEETAKKEEEEEPVQETQTINTAQEIHLPMDDDPDKKWAYEIEDESIVKITEETQLEPGEKTPSQQETIDVAKAEDGKEDENGSQVYVVEAAGEGNTTITFTYEEGEKGTDSYAYSDRVLLECSVDKNGNLTTNLKTGMIEEEMSEYMYDGYDKLKEAAGIDILSIDMEGYTPKDYFFNQAVTSITYEGDETVKNTYTAYTTLINIGFESSFDSPLKTEEIDGTQVEVIREKDKVLAKWHLTNLFYCIYGAGENFDNFDQVVLEAVKTSKKLSQDTSGSPLTIEKKLAQEAESIVNGTEDADAGDTEAQEPVQDEQKKE